MEETILFRLRAPAREIYEPLPAEVCTQVNLERKLEKRRLEWVVCVCERVEISYKREWGYVRGGVGDGDVRGAGGNVESTP